MRSSTGQHFVALDHVRGLAAFLVVAWHFLHFDNGTPVPFEGAPVIFPLAMADEGHTGVALFMVLSGYLFAKLLDGKRVSYRAFLWNRLIRLAPLLLLVLLAIGVERAISGDGLRDYVVLLAKGVLLPTWPNGGWSITCEMHFYLVLPVLLLIARRSPALLLVVVLVAIGVRFGLHERWGQVQTVAYWTLVGRIDQFTLGILAFLWSQHIGTAPRAVGIVLLAFGVFWWWFDWIGGFYQLPTYPSTSRLWVVLPALEGIAYGIGIAWYDTRRTARQGPLWGLLQRLGEYSYSIYLLHFFVVFRVASLIDRHIMDISNIYVGLAWAAVFFVAMVVPGYLSFRYIESPFLRHRKQYVLATSD